MHGQSSTPEATSPESRSLQEWPPVIYATPHATDTKPVIPAGSVGCISSPRIVSSPPLTPVWFVWKGWPVNPKLMEKFGAWARSLIMRHQTAVDMPIGLGAISIALLLEEESDHSQQFKKAKAFITGIFFKYAYLKTNFGLLGDDLLIHELKQFHTLDYAQFVRQVGVDLAPSGYAPQHKQEATGSLTFGLHPPWEGPHAFGGAGIHRQPLLPLLPPHVHNRFTFEAPLHPPVHTFLNPLPQFRAGLDNETAAILN